jgi:hypothetical protein
MATKNKYSDIDLSKYGQGYQASTSVNAAEAQKNAAENAVKNYGDFKYSNQSAYDNAMNAYLNRGEFKYDLNSDALYQQYKNQYTNLGKMAMMDTMGQASAMTGGYGNSYASTAGNQAYQGYLQNLNDVVPELYQMALNKYQAEGDQLLNNYNMLSQDRATEYSEWGDKYNQLVADRGYFADSYTDAYNRDYGAWNDNRAYDTDMYWNEYTTGYQADRDIIADQQWQKEYDESVRQYNTSLAEQQRQHNESLAEQKRQYNTSLWEERRQFNKTLEAQAAAATAKESDSGYTYAGKDDDGNTLFYRDGKQYTFGKGINPHTGTTNTDIKYGAFDNGYQPNNIGGKKLKTTGEYDVINGNTQKIWKTPDGTKYIWDGTKNRYLIYDDSED